MKRSSAIEVRGLYYKRISIPMAARVTEIGANVGWRMGAAIGRNYADIMNHFLFDGYISRTLHNLQITVVAFGKHRRPLVGPQNAALTDGAVLRAVPLMAAIGCLAVGDAFLCFRQQCGKPPLRTHNDRCPLTGAGLRLRN